MKAKVVITLLCAAAAGYIGTSLYTPEETQQVQKQPVEQEKEQLPVVKNEVVEQDIEPVIENKRAAEEIVAEAEAYKGTTTLIEQALSEDKSKEEHYYDFIVTHFPQLEEQVNDYRDATRIQNERISSLQALVEERNKQALASGEASSGVDQQIMYEREQLIAQAKELGRKGVALNEAVRLAAQN
ncbi:hypothetical protein N473_06335 [Pseudoalteromonas luteoviolacea CPMOR-1]|uniref:Uncharacterized protein n=1 Tax=Pseudoalteromonas luteoviolacea CPMOR-1 TaxID=1365248 RepID=A0A162APC4_9GAMM|nr:hypothetical protein [Pseudoalteromonas luteoviolacea]KZN57499.1 hypothetical protein N473_06335 [Pseudoalteromonas luteoviolacea CPMOR-1]